MTQSGDIMIDIYAMRVGVEAENMVQTHMAEAIANAGKTERGDKGGSTQGGNCARVQAGQVRHPR